MCASGTPPPPVLLYTFARRRDGDGLAAPGAAGIPSLRGSRDAEAVLPQDVPEDDDPVLYDSAPRSTSRDLSCAAVTRPTDSWSYFGLTAVRCKLCLSSLVRRRIISYDERCGPAT